MDNDRTQLVPGPPGAGGTMMGGQTASYDPNRTQMAPPPAPGGFAPATPGGPALSLSVRPGSRSAYAGGRTRQYVLTQLTASGSGGAVGGGGPRLPVNVALVIDRSGSMEGEPLEYVKRACSYVVDMLTPNDVLSIVTFEETVEVLMPARRVTDPGLIKQHIARITPGNTTNLFDGLYAGGAQVASVPPAGYVNRVLLLTDGEPTAGLKDFASIVAQVGDLRQRGIAVAALGFGPEYNEELMAGIARRSGGNYYHIERPEMIPDVFRREMEQALGVTAKNIRLAFHLPGNTLVRQVYGTPPVFGSRTAEITLGDLERGASVTKIWEMDWEPRTGGTYRVAKVVLTYEDGATGRTETQMLDAVVDFSDDPRAAENTADPQVAQEVALAQSSRDLERTMMGMRTQQFNAADLTRALERTQMLLTQQGRSQEAQEIAQAAQTARTMAMAPAGAPSVGVGAASAVDLNKTLIGAIYHLDQGKRSR